MAQLQIHGYAADGSKKAVAVSEIDDEILPLAQQYSWFMSGDYAATSIKGVVKPLHYFVWEYFEGQESIPDDLQLDHRNKDKLDNTFANLEFVDDRVKNANAPKRRDNTTGYKDVFDYGNRFGAKIKRDYKFIHLGRYVTAEEAAYAVNLGYAKFHPEVPVPNEGVETRLSPEQRNTVEANVERLLRPDRRPYQA